MKSARIVSLVIGSPRAGGHSSQSASRAAVSNDRDRIARRLNDDVIRGMFGVGLRLQATAQLADGTVQTRLELAIHDLDLIIAEVRNVIFDRNPGLQLSSDELISDLGLRASPLAEKLDAFCIYEATGT
jgi:signal transduction histidine kinase